LREGDRITTKTSFKTPIAFRFEAKAIYGDVRFGFIQKEMILGWHGGDILKIGDGPNNSLKGPFDGDHRAGMGSIPDDDWFTVDMIATKTFLELRVNGNQRYKRAHNLSQYDQPLTIFQGEKSIVHIRTLESGNPAFDKNEQNQPIIENTNKINPADIIYAEWGATKDNAYYFVNQTQNGDSLSSKVKSLFASPSVVKLENSTLEVNDPIYGPHKQLKLILSGNRCYSYDEYNKLTIDSAADISSFEPHTENHCSSSSSNYIQVKHDGIAKAKEIRQFIEICKEIVKRGIPISGELNVANVGVGIAAYLEQVDEDSTNLLRFCQSLTDWKTGFFDDSFERAWQNLLPQLLRSAIALENIRS
jgi:hypothetical protein